MGLLDIFSLLILLIILALVVGLILLLAWLPGNIARKRHNPWAEAINVAGWIGILLFPIWMLALISAFVRPSTGEGTAISINESEGAELMATLAAISTRVASLGIGLRNFASKARSQAAGGLQP